MVKSESKMIQGKTHLWNWIDGILQVFEIHTDAAEHLLRIERFVKFKNRSNVIIIDTSKLDFKSLE